MPRYRGTTEGAATLIGRLLLLIADGKETSASLAAKLHVSARQVNRYILDLRKARWLIERHGTPTHQDYYFELSSPQIVFDVPKATSKKKRSQT
jgi:hypothetical protein